MAELRSKPFSDSPRHSSQLVAYDFPSQLVLGISPYLLTYLFIKFQISEDGKLMMMSRSTKLLLCPIPV